MPTVAPSAARPSASALPKPLAAPLIKKFCPAKALVTDFTPWLELRCTASASRTLGKDSLGRVLQQNADGISVVGHLHDAVDVHLAYGPLTKPVCWHCFAREPTLFNPSRDIIRLSVYAGNHRAGRRTIGTELRAALRSADASRVHRHLERGSLVVIETALTYELPRRRAQGGTQPGGPRRPGDRRNDRHRQGDGAGICCARCARLLRRTGGGGRKRGR